MSIDVDISITEDGFIRIRDYISDAILLNGEEAELIRDFINENLEKIKPIEEKEMSAVESIKEIKLVGNFPAPPFEVERYEFRPAHKDEWFFYEQYFGWYQTDGTDIMKADIIAIPKKKPVYNFPPDFKPGTILKHTENYGWAFHDAKNLVTSLVYMKLLIDVPDVPEGTPLDTVFVKD